MSRSVEELEVSIAALTSPGRRGRLLARGMARGMLWRNGIVPEGTPSFSTTLTEDLLDHGYVLLEQSLELRSQGGSDDIATAGFRVAAEAIESAVRRDASGRPMRSFHLLVAGAAFHFARLAARSYCLLPGSDDQSFLLSAPERALASLIRRDFHGLRDTIWRWLSAVRHTDEGVAAELESDSDFDLDDAVAIALTRQFMRALALFDWALVTGGPEQVLGARELLRAVQGAAADARAVPQWWLATLGLHLVDEIWNSSLHTRLPILPSDAAWNRLREQYVSVLAARRVAEVDLWPSQLEAARRAVDPLDDLIAALPTSAGKTRIAELCILRTLSLGKRVVYVTPLRALSAQVERSLAKVFAPLGFSVSSLYGASGVSMADVATLKSSDIVVATPEKLDFSVRQEQDVISDVGLIVLDEGHMIGDGEREVRYEVLVQRLLRRPDADRRRLVCLSAIFSQGQAFDDFTQWLRSDAPGDAIHSTWRPTRQRTGIVEWRNGAGRLDLEVDGEQPFVPRFVQPMHPVGRRRRAVPSNHAEFVIATSRALVGDGHRVLIYCPVRRSVSSLAKAYLTLNKQGYAPGYLNEPRKIDRALWIADEWLGADHPSTQILRLGVGTHHAGLPRPFLTEVEDLLQARVLPIVIASPTVAQGLDLSASALVLHSLYRNRDTIQPQEFANVIGRAGRAYVDLDGLTIYPIFEPQGDETRAGRRKRQKKRYDYVRLREAAGERTMESGLVLVIQQLANALASRLGVSGVRLLEHVANMATWDALSLDPATSPTSGDEADDVEGDAAQTARLLSDLDTAILSAVDEPNCPLEELAAALDAALQSSLWRRRLERRDVRDLELQREIVVGRAHWLWHRTTEQERAAFYAAGLGYSAGTYINRNLATLSAQLLAVENALSTGDVETALTNLRSLAAVLFAVRPFHYKDLREGWESVMDGWIRGQPTSDFVGSIGGDEVALIQEAFVYRLVWGVEAVRVQATAMGVPGISSIAGRTALALTYGLPSLQACLLAQSGVPSRIMAARLVNAFPSDFEDRQGLSAWLDRVAAEVDDSFWNHPVAADVWQEFVGRPSSGVRSKWAHTTTTHTAVWLAAPPPASGTPLRLVHDADRGITHVLSTDLGVLGVLTTQWPPASSGRTYALVAEDGDSVIAQRFGPPEA